MASNLIDTNCILDLMNILVKPEFIPARKNDKDAEKENVYSIFDTALKNCLEAFWKTLEGEKHLAFRNIFQENRNKLKHKCNAESIVQTYLEVCEVLLYTLHTIMQEKMTEFKKREKRELKPNEAPPLSPDTLSVSHQKTILSLLQFIVVLGVCPHLQPGVGIPIEKRSEYGKLLLESSMSSNMSNEEHHVSLLQTLWVLVTCLKSPSLAQILLSCHFGDILAALLQVIHGGCEGKSESRTTTRLQTDIDHKDECGASDEEKVKPDAGKWTPATVVDMITHKSEAYFIDKTKNSSEDQPLCSLQTGEKATKSTNTESQVYNRDDHKATDVDSEQWTRDTSFCEECLSDLLKKVHPALVVRELLILQGAPGPNFTKKQSVNRKFALCRSPPWLRRICGRMLSDILTGPDGVINIIKGMLGNLPDDSKVGTPDWRKFDAVAKVIATCPSYMESMEEYYQKISSQILQLLHPRDRQIGRGLLRVACTTISLMAAQNMVLTEKHLIQPLCRPLILTTEYQELDTRHGDQFIIVDEKEMRECIEGLHKVFVGGAEPSSRLYPSLLPVCQPLFELFCFTRGGTSHLSSSSQEVIVSVLKNLDPPLCLSVLKFLLLQDHTDMCTKSMKVMSPNLIFAVGDQGGVEIVTRLQSDTGERNHNRVVRAFVDILKPLQHTGVTGDFLIFTLKELQRIITDEISSEDDTLPGSSPTPHSSDSSSQCLLDIEDRHNRELRSYDQKVLVLSVLAQLCEDLGPSCIKSPSQTLSFVQATLERAIQICSQSEDEMTGYFESETLSMAMGLLTAMLSGAVEMNDKDRSDMSSLMPLLDEVSRVHADPSMQEMASDLRIAIATHGVVWSEKLKQKAPQEKDSSNSGKSQSKPLIEELSSTETQQQQVNRKTDNDRTKEKVDQTELDQAMEEICDPLIPVRGHALITMCRLIKNKDPEALTRQENLLKIFQENLTHPDSYLYLAAVNGLVAMADIFPDVIIPCLVQEYRGSLSKIDKVKCNRSKVNMEGKHDAETRMKVGECLVQSSRKLGDLAPKYRDVLVSAFLMGAKDPDPLIRASCMSNLGEVCSVLRFYLGPIIQEVFTCCSALLKSDSDVEVRKASALTLTLILRGLGKNVLQVLGSVIRDLYQLLKLTERSEKDEGVRRQIILAYNELDDIMREELFPKQVLQKKIRVLDSES
ncbi:transport and Golgi organization protein 6 homolog [Saccostrea echinata]|uniref:transport and Golgi organization protein 6 homolog n=1 Tax=Saccostrea echinata TaxID=191078 RepID=UPI002A807CB6|nr:transport and Golgi organization protein 6 homolog [Saccostrea echinata]